MTERRRISSNSPYEGIIGFSRAVRVGDTVYVSGTVAWGDDGKLVGAGDVYAQARQAIRNIEKALAEAGASLARTLQAFQIGVDRLGGAATVGQGGDHQVGAVDVVAASEDAGPGGLELLVHPDPLAVAGAQARSGLL